MAQVALHLIVGSPMKTSIAGKLRNIRVPKSTPLLPVFEAIVNSFQSLDESQVADPLIQIELKRTPLLVDRAPAPIESIVVSDNGKGFDDENFNHFISAETLHKVSMGGKGVGRFSWLAVFHSAKIASIFRDGSEYKLREFTFAEFQDPEENAQTKAAEGNQLWTEITLDSLRAEFENDFPRDADVIAQQIVEHCFLMLSEASSPKVLLIDEGCVTNLNDYCKTYAQDRAFIREFILDNHCFTYTGLRITELVKGERREHKLHLSAHGRSVRALRLRSQVPNLRGVPTDEAGQPFVYTAYITGPLLDSTVNENRTDFKLLKSQAEVEQYGDLIAEPTIEAIQKKAIEFLKEDLAQVITSINEEKRREVDVIVMQYPEYQPLMKYWSDFADKVSPGASAAEIERILDDEAHKRKVQMRKDSQRILKRFHQATIEEKEKLSEELMAKIGEVEMQALAEYVVHRRAVIELLEKYMAMDTETGRPHLERVLHSIVFPTRTTSNDIQFSDQNLWLVDERLNYHSFIASDRSLKEIKDLDSNELTRPDLTIVKKLFDRPHLLVERPAAPHHSFVIVEFKRPNHTTVSKDNPIGQIFEQIQKVRQASWRDRSGRSLPLAKDARAYAYVVCDNSADVRQFADLYSLKPTPDNLGFFGYNSADSINAYIEVITYDKLLEDAKQRNQALFRRLNIG